MDRLLNKAQQRIQAQILGVRDYQDHADRYYLLGQLLKCRVMVVPLRSRGNRLMPAKSFRRPFVQAE